MATKSLKSTKIDGLKVYNVLDDGKLKDTAAFINGEVRTLTHGLIAEVIQPAELELATFVLVCANHLKVSWTRRFQAKITDTFHTVSGPKTMCFLTGKVRCSRKKSTDGTLISIPLLGDAHFVIYQPTSTTSALPFLDFLVTVGGPVNPYTVGPEDSEHLPTYEVKLTVPKLTVRSSIDLNEVFSKAGLPLGEKLVSVEGTEDRGITTFRQDNIVKTTLEGVEAASVTVATNAFGGLVNISINRPHFIAILVPLPDGSFMPAYMGYIGDPTN